MTYLRSTVYQVLFYLSICAAGTFYLPLLVMPRRWFVPAGRFWCRCVMWLLRVTVRLEYRVEGRENIPDEPVIYAIKHQSAWDTIVVCLLIRDPAIVLKRELLPIPLFGWYLWKHGMIGIDRKAGSSALRKLVADAEAALREGRPPVVFPEGTRTAPGEHKPYQPGIAALYTRLGVPVVPVALNSGVFWRRREFVKRPGCITVRFLPPIAPGLPRREFMAALATRIDTATAELVEQARSSTSGPVGRDATSPVDNSPPTPVNTVEN